MEAIAMSPTSTRISKLLLLNVFLMVGCYYKPWRVEQYIVSNGPSASYVGESILQYPEHSVAKVVFQVALFDTQSQDGRHDPYKLHIGVWKERRQTRLVQIEGVSVRSEDGSGFVCATNDIPITFSFERQSDMLEFATFDSQERLSLHPSNKQRVFVSIQVKVQYDGKTERRVLFYEFCPKIEKGRFRLLTTV